MENLQDSTPEDFEDGGFDFGEIDLGNLDG